MAPKTLNIVFAGDSSQLSKTFKNIDKDASGMGAGIKKAAGVVAGGLVAAGAAAVAFGASSIKAFAESEKVGAQTAAVIKSTGGAAKVTADEVGALALKIQNYSGISDEAVQSGANMLLTFKNIRNEAGAGNDIFNQSTAILADLSVAMGTDMSTSAIQLGKALNDPIAGISALSRVGIQFDEGQKKAIQTMVEAGNVMGAQKIILAELESQFGGSAAAAGDTFAGKLNILKESLGGVQEAIGQVLVEHVLPKFLQGLLGGEVNSENLAQRLTELAPKIEEAGVKFGKVAEDIGEFIAQIKGAITWVSNFIGTLDRIIGKDSALNRIVTVLLSASSAAARLTGNLGAAISKSSQAAAIGAFAGAAGAIPRRAAGGPVTKGDPFWVGEKGPELFVPKSHGTIVPNGSGRGSTLAGAGSPINIYVAGSVVTERQLMDVINEAVARKDAANGQRPSRYF